MSESGQSQDSGVIMMDSSEDELASSGELDAAHEAVEPASASAYRIIDAALVSNVQRSAIERATALLACTDSEAAIVLRHFRWNVDRLMEAVVEGDRDAVFSRAGAISSGQAETAMETSSSVCMICMDALTDPAQSLTMSCGHTFCKGCWLSHFQVLIREGRACNLPCMAYKCGAICSQPAVKALLAERDAAALDKYEHAIVNSYIEDNSNVRWCPSVPSCERAVEALDDGYVEPRCPCGLAFCFRCGAAPHSPATCKMWAEWQTKLSDDSETLNYLKAHVKPCPKCSAPVEKDGGCNLVVCRSCRQAFCWLCGAKTGTRHTWERIEGHTCGEWKAAADRDIAQSKAKHQRYMHYYQHYLGHAESLKKEREGSSVGALIDDLRQHVSSTVDWAYLHQAQAVLLECRRVLSNAYVFSFSMFDPDNFKQDMSASENLRLQHLFEDGMATLTTSVETLSHQLSEELGLLRARVDDVIHPRDGEGNAAPSSSSGWTAGDFDGDAERTKSRLDIMNLAVNLDKRIRNLFELAEREVLAAVCSQNMQIAPYSPVYRPPTSM